MKRFCLFPLSLLFFAHAAKGQQRNDSAFHAIKMSKDNIKIVPIQLLPQDYYAINLGFFCKTEIQVQKTLKIPLKFRLGSVSYCDAMEGKSPYYFMKPK